MSCDVCWFALFVLCVVVRARCGMCAAQCVCVCMLCVVRCIICNMCCICGVLHVACVCDAFWI